MVTEGYPITGRSTEKPNGYRVVSGNVWPELVTVGMVMRPMVSDMGCGLSWRTNGDLLEQVCQNAVGAFCRDRHFFQVWQPPPVRRKAPEPDLRNDNPAKWIRQEPGLRDNNGSCVLFRTTP